MSESRLELLSLPLSGATIRRDSAGDGHFGARRGSRNHLGSDLETTPIPTADFVDVLAPCDGEILRHGICYDPTKFPERAFLRLIEMTWPLGLQQLLYLEPLADEGATVKEGDVIGRLMDGSTVWTGGAGPHLHWQVELDRRHLRFHPVGDTSSRRVFWDPMTLVKG